MSPAEVRHHRVRGLPRDGRHWIAAIGVAVQAGVGIYGASRSSGGKLTTAEKAYIEQARRREDEAYRFQQLMTPFMLEDMGLDAEFGPNGQILSLKRRAKTPQQLQQDEIIDLAQKKTLKGLKGELDVDPATETAVKRNMEIKREQVRRAYGPGGDLSTGGQTVLNQAQASGDALREAVRRGEMTNAEAMARSNIAQQQQEEQYRNQQARGLPMDAMRLSQSMTPWDSYLGGAKRLGQAANANFYTHLGGVIGSLGNTASRMYKNWPSSSSAVPYDTSVNYGGNVYGGDAPIDWNAPAW